MQVEWWYWIIAGICLVGLELIVPSFTIIWFGLGALVVGIAQAPLARISRGWAGVSLVGGIDLLHGHVVQVLETQKRPYTFRYVQRSHRR